MSHGVSVVFPCLNEELSVARVVNKTRGSLETLGLPFEILVVDNASDDRSKEVASAAGAVVIEEAQRGYGAAIRRGFEEAQYDILVMADADDTYDLTHVDELLTPILEGEADLVIGNRMDGLHPDSMPLLHRHVGNPMLTRLVRIWFHRKDILDAHSGFRVIRRSTYRDLGCISTGMEFASEMIVRAIQQNVRIQFRNIEYHPRVGESKLRTFRDGWRHLRFLLLHSPTMVILLPGLFVWLSTLLAPLHPMAESPLFLMFCCLLNAISLQGISIAILAKAYAHLSGFHDDRLVQWLYRRFSFENGALAALVLLLAGMGTAVCMVFSFQGEGENLWYLRGFAFSSLLILNSTQVGLTSYLFSILALPRRLESPPLHGDPQAGIRNIP